MPAGRSRSSRCGATPPTPAPATAPGRAPTRRCPRARYEPRSAGGLGLGRPLTDPLRLVHALGRLIAGQPFRRVDVAPRRLRGEQVPRGLDAEAVVEDRGQRLLLHLAEA